MLTIKQISLRAVSGGMPIYPSHRRPTPSKRANKNGTGKPDAIFSFSILSNQHPLSSFSTPVQHFYKEGRLMAKSFAITALIILALLLAGCGNQPKVDPTKMINLLAYEPEAWEFLPSKILTRKEQWEIRKEGRISSMCDTTAGFFYLLDQNGQLARQGHHFVIVIALCKNSQVVAQQRDCWKKEYGLRDLLDEHQANDSGVIGTKEAVIVMAIGTKWLNLDQLVERLLDRTTAQLGLEERWERRIHSLKLEQDTILFDAKSELLKAITAVWDFVQTWQGIAGLITILLTIVFAIVKKTWLAKD